MNKVKNSSEKIAKRKYAENSVNEANINEKIAVRQTVIKTDNLNKYLNQIKHENSLISENGLKNSKSSKNSNSAAVSKSELAANYLKNQGINEKS